ncbi:MAG: HlyD family type I secretion periplasmic adaptor subunit [Alphaproteobacteria bacterium]|nr:HlyD family type I secretion periplasmic adaptor subunit [Alphaproteobacteria bacterium]MBV9375488.1 HlyD family type I secretion periplasmic adaptor subunit [Alphaproteobacteria bacterium]
MSLTPVPARTAVVPAAPSSAASPRALIDYDFETVLRVPPKRRLVLWLMVALIAAAAIALAVLKVDIVVSANGKIVTSDSEIVVQPVETSVVRSIAVRMGQQVKAGDLLATLDPTFSQADRDELVAKLRNLCATYDRLDAELAGRAYDPANPNADEQTQRDVFRKRQAEYTAKLGAAERKAEQYKADLAAHKIEVKNLEEQIRLASQAEGMYQQLVAKDLASKLKLIEASQHLVDARTRLDTNLGEQQKLAEQIAGAEAERDGFKEEWQRKLSEDMAQTRSDRDGAAARLSKAQLRHELAVMTAPEDATVLELAHRPAGSVLREAETLMRLVPKHAPLLFEVQVDTRDVARLHIGDRATIKLEALPWQQFGLAYGVLKALTPDTVGDDNARETSEEGASPELKNQARQSPTHYRARIELTQAKFRNLPEGFALRPGMRVVCDIKVGRRSILDYVMNPITRVIGESLREP